jgi:hypothetical protein
MDSGKSGGQNPPFAAIDGTISHVQDDLGVTVMKAAS